jgi:hypothetical protein
MCGAELNFGFETPYAIINPMVTFLMEVNS